MKEKEIALFFGHLADMISVGIPLKEGISNFQFKDRRVGREIVKYMEQKGMGFADSLHKTGQFPTFAYSTIKAGESGGNLEESLKSIRDSIDEDVQFKAHLKKTLFMPGVNLLFIFGAVIFLATNTLPKLESAVTSLGNVPDFSKQVFLVSGFIKGNLTAILGTIVATIVTFTVWLRTAPPFLLSMPLIGSLLKYRFIISFFSRLQIIHSAGVSLSEAMKIIEKSETGHFQEVIRKGLKKLDRGKQLDEIFNDPFYPVTIMQMVKTASMTGKLDDTFKFIATIYKRNLKQQADKISAVLEPLSLVIVGAVVLIVMLSVLYPIMSATDTMK